MVFRINTCPAGPLCSSCCATLAMEVRLATPSLHPVRCKGMVYDHQAERDCAILKRDSRKARPGAGHSKTGRFVTVGRQLSKLDPGYQSSSDESDLLKKDRSTVKQRVCIY